MTTATPPTPEAELLLIYAQAVVPPADDARARAVIDGGLDWDAFYGRATAHQVVPTVYANLQRAGRAGAAAASLGPFRMWALELSARSLQLTDELRRLAGLFGDAGLDVLAFKGPALAHAAYGSISARISGDLDLLVRPDAFAEAEAVLLAHGYAPRGSFTDRQRALFLRLEGGFQYVHADLGSAVDLHARVAARRYSYAPSFDELWGRAERVALRVRPDAGGFSVRAPGAEDLVLLLCWHGAKHDWDLLKFVRDVAELVRASPGLDWDAVRDRARRLRAERMLDVGLWLAHDLGRAGLPDRVLREAGRTPRARALARALGDRLLEGGAWGYLRHHAFQLRMRGSAAARLRYAASVLAFNKVSRDLVLRPG